MPRVQSYGAQRVAPAALPGARKGNSAETFESTGGTVAQADAELARARGSVGGAVAGVGQVGARLAVQTLAINEQLRREEQTKADQVAILSMRRQFGELQLALLNAPDHGALNAKGKDVLPVAQQTLEAYDAQAGKIGEGLKTDRQRLAYTELRDNTRLNVSSTLNDHVVKEMNEFDKSESLALLDNLVTMGTANAGAPDKINDVLRQGEGTIDELAARHKEIGPEGAKKMAAIWRNQLWKNIITNRISNGDDHLADVYLEAAEHHGQLTGDTLNDMRQAVKASNTAATGERVAGEIWNQLGPKTDGDVISLDTMEAEARRRLTPSMGQRADGSEKGTGFLGLLKRPDGNYSSELSISVQFGDKEVEIPSMVPTLTADEVRTLLSLKENEQPPQSIVDKAIAYARPRLAAGKSPFAQAGEENTTLYPEFDRTAAPKMDIKALDATIQALRSRKAGVDDGRKARLDHLNETVYGAMFKGAPLSQVARMPEFINGGGEFQVKVRDYYQSKADQAESRAATRENRLAAVETRELNAETREQRRLELRGFATYYEFSDPKRLRTLSRGDILAMLPTMGDAHVGRLLGDKEKQERDDDSFRAAVIDKDLFNEVANAGGLTYVYKKPGEISETERANLGKLQASVEDEIARAQTSAKRRLTREESRSVMESVVDSKVMLHANYWFQSDDSQVATIVNEKDRARAYVPIDQVPAAAVDDYVNYLISVIPELGIQKVPASEIKGRYTERMQRAYALKLLGASNAELKAALQGAK